MRILLDECLPSRLRHELPQHQVRTVKQMGWLGIKNGAFLKLIAGSGEFDVFVTMDKNLPHQQNLKDLPFGIAILRARSNRFEATQPLMPLFEERLHELKPGTVITISAT